MKKKIPIGLRKIVDEVYKGNENLINIEFGDDYVIKFTDSDIESDYFFVIKKIEPKNNGNAIYNVEYKPYNEETVDRRSVNLGLSNFKEFFTKWKTLLVEASQSSPIFDDIFSQAYYDEIEPEFEILDEDANYKPFKIAQQQRIILFLDKVESIVNNESNEDKVEIINIIKNTKKKITTLTKKEVVKNIRKIIAKGFKIGLQIGEKLLIEFSTELAKKLITN